jgi:hypothetical protein
MMHASESPPLWPLMRDAAFGASLATSIPGPRATGYFSSCELFDFTAMPFWRWRRLAGGAFIASEIIATGASIST